VGDLTSLTGLLPFHTDGWLCCSAECAKYGKVRAVKVAVAGAAVRVFVLFGAATQGGHQQAAAAVAALNKRWFAGRQLSAALFDQSKFDAGETA